MNVQRQRPIERPNIALLQGLLIIQLIETRVKPIRSGIRGVSWTVFGQGFYQMPIEVYLALWNVHFESLFSFVIVNKLIIAQILPPRR